MNRVQSLLQRHVPTVWYTPVGRLPAAWKRLGIDCSLSSDCLKPMKIEARARSIERLHEEFKRRIETQTVLPSEETAAVLIWALLASGQITMRRVDGEQTLAEPPALQCIDSAA
jgi:transposase-like protein